MSEEAARLFVLGSFVNACCADVDHLPRPGESLLAARFTTEPGGKGFNVAVGARRLGAPVDCLAAIGEDLFGQLAEPAFTAGGLSTELLRRYATPTGAGIGFIQPNGENCLAVFPGANLSLSAEDVRAVAGQVASAAMVIAQFEITDAPIREAFAIALEAARPTLLNPSPFRMPAPDLLAATTILVANERETEALATGLGLGSEVGVDMARGLASVLHERGVAVLVVTLGARGALAYPRDAAPVVQPAYVVDAVDSLGAGDAFIAALAVSLARGEPLAGALRLAAAAGAVMASRAGTFAALPNRADVDRLMETGRR